MERIMGALLMTIALLGCTVVRAQGDIEPIMVAPSEVKWLDFPGIPGRKLANIQGNLEQPGPYIVRVLLPAGSKLPPHWHPIIDSITVISGVFYLGVGDTIDPAKARALPAGSAIAMSARR